MYIWTVLNPSNLVVNRSDRSLIRHSNYVWHTDSFVGDGRLDQDVHVDVVEVVNPAPPVTIGLECADGLSPLLPDKTR